MKFKIIFSVLVASISLCACNNNNTSSNNTAGQTPVAIAEQPLAEIKGQAVFGQKCASCHGSDGTAGIANAANLKASKLDSAAITKTITEGKGGMPPFSSQLTKDEIAAISGYVLTMRK